MKQLFLLLTAMLLFTAASQAQNTLKDFLASSEPLTYLGIDFTQARVIGEATTDPKDMRDRFFPSINAVILNEPKKYDIAGAFHREVKPDLEQVKKHNADINTDHLASENASDYNHLKPADIDKVAKGYSFGGKKGVALLFVMDGMSKAEKGANVYATLIDMSNSKVLVTEKIEAKAQGFGFRNYWAYTIYKVLENIEKHKYKEWKGK